MRVNVSRRRMLLTAAAVVPALAWPGLVFGAVTCPRRLSFYHTHTSETLDVVYCEDGRYVPGALDEVNHLLRDFRTGDVHAIDPGLLDVLYSLQKSTGAGQHYEIISGYRSPATMGRPT